MSGNVWEWTRSLWGKQWNEPSFPYPYDPLDGRENEAAPDSVLRVLRGGAFDYGEDGVRCSARDGDDPNRRDFDRGFRVFLLPLSVDGRSIDR